MSQRIKSKKYNNSRWLLHASSGKVPQLDRQPERVQSPEAQGAYLLVLSFMDKYSRAYVTYFWNNNRRESIGDTPTW